MSLKESKPKSLSAQKQQELLESFINVKQYDKLLYYLESTLFNNAPVLNCPSPFVINSLFTLATLGDYYNADLIRKEFDKPLSSQPIHTRAVNILRRLMDIILQTHQKNEFFQTKYNNEDIEYAKYQLRKSLELIRTDKGRSLRPRLHNTRYKEKTEAEFDAFATKDSDSGKIVNSTDWSPQKKLLEQQFQMIQGPGQESDSESESEGEGSLDRKSYMILKNERFDIALQNDRFWAAVSWALQCSASKERIHLEVWKVWKPILEIVFDIASFDLEDFIEAKVKNIDDENDIPVLFTDTACYKLFEKVGRYYLMRKIADILFIGSNEAEDKMFKRKIEPIFINELTTAKSVYLTDSLIVRPDDEEITLESMIFRKKIFYLAYKAAKHGNMEEGYTKQLKFSAWDLARYVTLKLVDASYVDFRKFFVLDESEIFEDWKLDAIVDILFDWFVQVNTYKFDTPLSSFVFDDDSEFIATFLKNVTYEKKYYAELDGHTNVQKMQSDFSKLNFGLFILLNLWLKLSGYLSTGNNEKLTRIIAWCVSGEDKRRAVLKSAKPSDDQIDNDLFSLVKTVKLQFSI